MSGSELSASFISSLIEDARQDRYRRLHDLYEGLKVNDSFLESFLGNMSEALDRNSSLSTALITEKLDVIEEIAPKGILPRNEVVRVVKESLAGRSTHRQSIQFQEKPTKVEAVVKPDLVIDVFIDIDHNEIFHKIRISKLFIRLKSLLSLTSDFINSHLDNVNINEVEFKIAISMGTPDGNVVIPIPENLSAEDTVKEIISLLANSASFRSRQMPRLKRAAKLYDFWIRKHVLINEVRQKGNKFFGIVIEQERNRDDIKFRDNKKILGRDYAVSTISFFD
jgi:hypothetical protein